MHRKFIQSPSNRCFLIDTRQICQLTIEPRNLESNMDPIVTLKLDPFFKIVISVGVESIYKIYESSNFRGPMLALNFCDLVFLGSAKLILLTVNLAAFENG